MLPTDCLATNPLLAFLGVFCILQLPDILMYRRLLSYDVSSIAEMMYCDAKYGIVS